MSNLKHVISFEFLMIVKTKGFIFTTLFLMLLGAGLGAIPILLDFFDGRLNFGDETLTVAIVDETGYFDEPLLSAHLPDSTFVFYSVGELATIATAVEAGDYAIGLHFVTGTSYGVIFANHMMGLPDQLLEDVNTMLTQRYQRELLAAHDLSPFLVMSLERIEIEQVLLPVGGFGFVVGQIINVLVFLPLITGGSMISTAVMNEKTAKTVELLFTSAKPKVVLVGKVIGAGLVVVSQALLVGGSFIGMLLLAVTLGTAYDIRQFLSVEVLGALLSPVTYAYVFVFFVSA